MSQNKLKGRNNTLNSTETAFYLQAAAGFSSSPPSCPSNSEYIQQTNSKKVLVHCSLSKAQKKKKKTGPMYSLLHHNISTLCQNQFNHSEKT
jgi:hypothetical protein